MASATINLKHRIVTPRRKPVGLICWLLRFPWADRIISVPSDAIIRMRLRRGRPIVKTRA